MRYGMVDLRLSVTRLLEVNFKEKDMAKPRAYTEKEVREHFLNHVRNMIRYWHGETQATTTLDKMEGLAFSILSCIDGCSMALPGFKMTPNPDKSDKQYSIDNGENWYPTNIDIAGSLHDQLLNKNKENI